jgi:hypothetical protein
MTGAQVLAGAAAGVGALIAGEQGARCFASYEAAWSGRVPDNLLAFHQGSTGAATPSGVFPCELS